MFDEKKYSYLIIFLAFILHILAINFYPINFEYTFIEGMDYVLQNFDKKIITVYFENQANTFFFSFIGSIIKYIFPFINGQYIAKFLSASGYFFLGFGIINLYKILKVKYSLNLLLIIIFLNPLIWIFGYRGTPDFLSAAISIYSISLILDKNISTLKNYLGFFLLGIAITLKPITGVFYITFLLFLIKERISLEKKINKIFISGFLTFLIPLIYFFLIYINFNFFLTPPYFVSKHNFNISNIYFFLNNSLVYLAFIFLFFSFSIFSNIYLVFAKYKISLISFIFFIIISFFFGLILNPSGEMSLGIFSDFINQDLLNGFYGVFLFLFLYFLYIYFKTHNKKGLDISKIFIISLLFLYFVLSFTATSQRYIILSIPVLIIIFTKKINRSDLIFAILFFCPINLFLLINQYSTGFASYNIVKYIKEKDIINITCAGAIAPHMNNYFPNQNRQQLNCIKLAKYLVVEGLNEKAIYQVSFYFKRFSIIKINQI